MKFKNKKLELGTRFYTFISEDEYRIIDLVKSENKSGKFMDEETFEILDISEEELDRKYILLTDYKLWILCNFKAKDEFRKSKKEYRDANFWLCNKDTVNFLCNQMLSYPYCIKIKLRLVVYKYMKQSVIYKLLSSIMKLNQPNFSLSEDDYECIWKEYFKYLTNDCSILLLDYSKDEKLNMDDVVNGKAKLSDKILEEAEELLNTFILTYEPYELDDSVNMDNVNMKHFIIYNNDKYYLILYVVDKSKESVSIRNNLIDNIDIVNFMLK